MRAHILHVPPNLAERMAATNDVIQCVSHGWCALRA